MVKLANGLQPSDLNHQKQQMRILRTAELILEGYSTLEIATDLGIDRTSAWKLTRDPRVLKIVTKERSPALHAAAVRNQIGITVALDLLMQMARDESKDPAHRIRAADLYLQRIGDIWGRDDIKQLASIAAKGEQMSIEKAKELLESTPKEVIVEVAPEPPEQDKDGD